MTDAATLLATARRATTDDLDAVIDTLTLAFVDDPVWKPTLSRAPGDVVAMERFWGDLVRAMVQYEWIWMLDEAAAVSVWLPPDSIELPEEDEHAFLDFVRDELGEERLEIVRGIFKAFERSRPTGEPYFYLSLLATNPKWRGLRLGINLLAANLQLIDALGLPTYLESSNPANVGRYQSVGYEPILKFEAPQGQVLTGMWRNVPHKT